MSVGEIIGLALTAGLLGGLAGAALVGVMLRRHRDAREQRRRRVEASARWLAARMNLSRTSVSFVAAFKALAAARPESIYFPLRMEEAQRVRAQWSEAARELDLAGASLRVWLDSSGERRQLSGFARIGADRLRVAIDGDEHEVDELLQALNLADRAAIEFVEHMVETFDKAGRGALFVDLLTRTATQVGGVVDGWSRG